MTTFDATAAKNRFGQLLEASARAPVAVERHGRVVAWVVSPSVFEGSPESPGERIAARLRAAGAVYAVVFGSVARGEARPDSDIDVAASFGRPMSADLRMAVIGLVADAAGRPVDLVDLESASGLVLARALGGREILCDSAATRARMARRLLRAEDDRIATAGAARIARASLFT